MVDGIINQLMEIGEAEACNIRQHGGGQGSGCDGSARSRAGIGAGRTASVRPWTRHGGGGRGTGRERRTRGIRGGVGVRTRRWTGSTTAVRSRSINRKLRMKAKKSPGKAPWGCNDDGKNKKLTRAGRDKIKGGQGQKGAVTIDFKVFARRC